MTIRPESNFLGAERVHLRRNTLGENHSSERSSTLKRIRSSRPQILWISTFAGSRSPPQFSWGKERDAFGYIVSTRSGLSRELCRTWNNDGEQQLVLIPNSVSSMSLHVINAILATCRWIIWLYTERLCSSFYSNLRHAYISIDIGVREMVKT